MRRLILASAAGVLALASHGVSTAHAATWWTLDTRGGDCLPASDMVHIVHDRAFASPFMLAEKMQKEGRANGPIQQKHTAFGSAYGVRYDGVMAAFFASKGGCEDFLRFARTHGDLP